MASYVYSKKKKKKKKKKQANGIKIYYFGDVNKWVDVPEYIKKKKNGVVVKEVNVHYHNPCSASVEAAKVTTKIKVCAATIMENTSIIINEVLANTSQGTQGSMPRTSAMKKIVRRKRKDISASPPNLLSLMELSSFGNKWNFVIVTRPFYENRLNWVADPAPPASCRLDDMTSPAPAPTVPTPPAEVHPRLPGRLRSRRRRRRKATASANRNSASCQADLATPPTRPANDNSSRWAPSIATRPRSTANDLPGIQPGTRSTSVEHHLQLHRCHSIPSQQPIGI